MPPISTALTTAYYDRQYNARASVQDPLAYMTRYTQESQAAFALSGAVRNQRYTLQLVGNGQPMAAGSHRASVRFRLEYF